LKVWDAPDFALDRRPKLVDSEINFGAEIDAREKYDDGTVIERHRDGTVKETRPDGTVKTFKRQEPAIFLASGTKRGLHFVQTYTIFQVRGNCPGAGDGWSLTI